MPSPHSHDGNWPDKPRHEHRRTNGERPHWGWGTYNPGNKPPEQHSDKGMWLYRNPREHGAA